MNAFRVTKQVESIRKRKFDGVDADGFDDRQMKKATALHVGGPEISQQRKIPTYLPAFSQPLTPVDSSDDESMDCDGNDWRYGRAPIDNSGRLSSCSISSVRANFDDDEDMEMVISPIVASLMMPPPSAFHNFQAPSRRPMPSLSCKPSPQSDQRLPTPIGPTFQPADFRAISLVPCFNQRGRHQNALSPVLGEEPTGLLSPMKSPDGEGQTRTAKLYVGFLSDCQKCIRKVPGHSTHILWS